MFQCENCHVPFADLTPTVKKLQRLPCFPLLIPLWPITQCSAGRVKFSRASGLFLWKDDSTSSKVWPSQQEGIAAVMRCWPRGEKRD